MFILSDIHDNFVDHRFSSLNRSALAGASLAKERRDLKRLEANEQADAETREINQPWLDPMANQNERQFASDIKGNLLGQKAAQMPAWKAANKVVSYGKITSMSIQEQRRSLPIYKLREQLVAAIRDVSTFLFTFSQSNTHVHS